jgi:hypothetical protein
VLVGKWLVEYWDENSSTFIEFQAVWDQTNEELDGDCYATFYLANTSENRALIQQDLLVAVWFDDTLVFSGTLSGGDLGSRRIKAVIYDTVMLTLDEAEPVSGVYDQKAASTIAADIVAGTGITLGDCPSTPVSVVLYNANRLDVFKFLADALNLNLFSTIGTTINLAVRGDGVVWTPSSISVSNRGLDRSKQRTKVIIRGLDCFGRHILGVAGSGTKVKTFSNNSVTDEATLNGLAAKKLSELNTDSSGAPVSVLITIGKSYAPGDSVTVVEYQYLLNGTYRIKQLNKTRTNVKLQLDKFRKSIDRSIEELRSWEDQGIYLPGSASWSLNLQGLVGLFHLNEGEGLVAKNSAPVDKPIDGVITDGSWEDGPITKILTFNGSSSMVSLGDASQVGINFVGKLSFGAWFSPSAANSTERNVCHKSGQFGLHYHSNTGVVTATITIGSSVHSFSSDAGVANVGARLFVMVTYDLAHVKMYVNGYLHKTWSQTGTPDSSANTVYLGVFLEGVLAEVMLWSRALVDQEVLELYFFPLLRSMNKVVPDGFYLTYGASTKESNSVVLDYLLNSLILSGEAVVSSATGTMNSYEAGYAVLALLEVGGSSYYSLCETILDLWASLQNSDGSWYQQYNPYTPYAVVDQTSLGTSGNLKVDSGAALLAWAMSVYDQLTSGTRYKTNVQHALAFLRDLQYSHIVAHSSNLLSNLILDTVTDTTALLADCAECLLSAKHAMDAYGGSLLTSAGYSVKTFSNDLYYSMCVVGWRGNVALYFDTSYPYEQNTNIPFNYKEKISYTQALCSWGIYEFAKSAYLTASDYTTDICESCIDYIITVTRGSWGGEYFCPYTGAEDETQDEFAGYSGLMCIASQTVNNTKYASLNTGLKDFIKWLTLPDGRICDVADAKGKLWRSKLGPAEEGGFLVLPIAIALLAGAGS